MSKKIQKPVKIVETVLRDAHQSLIATRMPTEKMLPIIDKMDQVGYHAVECWGGATFDACLRFLNEDPWDRLGKLKDGFKNTKLQMLFRGQNILGYRPYADDVVEYFVQKSAANGIDIIRIFDCLNDLRNLQSCVKAANKENVDLPLELHTHYTSGVASMTYLKAVESGVDIIDCAISPFALGTSQPATEVMVETFRGTPYDTGYDQKVLAEIADYFRPYREGCIENGLLNPKIWALISRRCSIRFRAACFPI